MLMRANSASSEMICSASRISRTIRTQPGYSRCLKHEFQIVEGQGRSNDRNESGSGESSQGRVSNTKRSEQQLSASLQAFQLVDTQHVFRTSCLKRHDLSGHDARSINNPGDSITRPLA